MKKRFYARLYRILYIFHKIIIYLIYVSILRPCFIHSEYKLRRFFAFFFPPDMGKYYISYTLYVFTQSLRNFYVLPYFMLIKLLFLLLSLSSSLRNQFPTFRESVAKFYLEFECLVSTTMSRNVEHITH